VAGSTLTATTDANAGSSSVSWATLVIAEFSVVHAASIVDGGGADEVDDVADDGSELQCPFGVTAVGLAVEALHHAPVPGDGRTRRAERRDRVVRPTADRTVFCEDPLELDRLRTQRIVCGAAAVEDPLDRGVAGCGRALEFDDGERLTVPPCAHGRRAALAS